MRRLCGRVGVAAGALVLTAATGCSADELAAWVAWYEREPGPATEFANRPDVQASLRAGADAQAEGGFAFTSPAIPRESLWDDIAWCESGGDWDHPPVTNRSGTYSGGLMIGHRWWPAYDGDEFAGAPYQATKAEQIVVAERIADDVGLDRGWQCWP